MNGNPKQTMETFVPDSGAGLRELTAGDVLLLERMDHPLARPTAEGEARPPVTDFDAMTLWWLLSVPCEEAFETYRGGKEAIEREVVAAASRIPLRALREAGAEVARIFDRALGAAVGGTDEGKKATSRGRPIRARASGGTSSSSTPSATSTGASRPTT